MAVYLGIGKALLELRLLGTCRTLYTLDGFEAVLLAYCSYIYPYCYHDKSDTPALVLQRIHYPRLLHRPTIHTKLKAHSGPPHRMPLKINPGVSPSPHYAQ